MTQNNLSDALKQLLADSYILMLKTQNYHWNVQGGNFHSLHEMFEEQYTDLWGAVDEIAERIRAIGSDAPGTFQQFQKLSSINSEHILTESKHMLSSLIEENKNVVLTAKLVVKSAQKIKDDASTDLAIGRIHVHEKNIWMMQSTLS